MTRGATKALAKEIAAAREVFAAALRFRGASEAWTAAALLRWMGPHNEATELAAIANLASASSAYVNAANAVLPIATVGTPITPDARPAIAEAIRYVLAAVRDGERHPWGDAWPMGDALSTVQLVRPATRGTTARSLRDIAWTGAFSFVSFTEAVDSGRAVELENMADADICEARRLESLDRNVKGGAGKRSLKPFRERVGEAAARRNNANAVSANRRAVEARERDWLRDQPQWVIDANEKLAALGAVGAISLKPKPARRSRNPK